MHSYTIQPIISADGTLVDKLFLVLNEKNGEFGPNIKKNWIFLQIFIYVVLNQEN